MTMIIQRCVVALWSCFFTVLNSLSQAVWNRQELVHLLTQLQAKYVWKLSVAQIAIGGETPRTGSSLLTSGELRGDLLNDLLDEVSRTHLDYTYV